MSDIRRVAVILANDTLYGQQAFQGIYQHIAADAKWEIHHEPLGKISPKQLDILFQDWKADGVICELVDRGLGQLIGNCGVPVVDISGCGDFHGITAVTVDNIAAGRLAFQHLLERGVRQFAVCVNSSKAQSRARQTGFVLAAREAGFPCAVYDDRAGAQSGNWFEERLGIAKWLQSLAKQTGVMAGEGYLAREIVWAGTKIGMLVPDELAVVGIEDDAMQSAMSPVPLTSIALPGRTIGQTAAKMLDKMMSGESPIEKTILLPPLGVKIRGSSDIYIGADAEMIRIRRFIQSNANKPIRVDDLVRETSMSRRSLEKRYLKAFGRTLGADIRGVHVELAKKKLSVTDMKVTHIGHACGFGTYSIFCRIFRREIGLTPGQYRQRFRVQDAPREPEDPPAESAPAWSTPDFQLAGSELKHIAV